MSKRFTFYVDCRFLLVSSCILLLIFTNIANWELVSAFQAALLPFTAPIWVDYGWTKEPKTGYLFSG